MWFLEIWFLKQVFRHYLLTCIDCRVLEVSLGLVPTSHVEVFEGNGRVPIDRVEAASYLSRYWKAVMCSH